MYSAIVSQLNPYEFRVGPDHGLDDVVPIPGGVPITHTDHLVWRNHNVDDTVMALRDTLTLFEHSRTWLGDADPAEVEHLVDELRSRRGAGWSRVNEGQVNTTNIPDLMRRIVRSRLPFSTITKLACRPEYMRERLHIMVNVPLNDWRGVDRWVLAGRGLRATSERWSVCLPSVRAWARMREGHDRGYEAAMAEGVRAYLRYDASQRPAIVARLKQKYPHADIELQHITRTTRKENGR